jgi:negative regulator of sigma E activity
MSKGIRASILNEDGEIISQVDCETLSEAKQKAAAMLTECIVDKICGLFKAEVSKNGACEWDKFAK